MPPSRPLPRAVPPPRVARPTPFTIRRGIKAPPVLAVAVAAVKVSAAE